MRSKFHHYKRIMPCLVLCLAAFAEHSIAQTPTASKQPTLSNATVGKARATLIAEGLESPWAMAWLPPIAGSTTPRVLVTERAGRMRIIAMDGKVGEPLKGVPKVHAVNQGGLLDVVLSPQFTSNRTIFFSYAEPSNEGARTVVARAELADEGLQNVTVIFGQKDRVSGGHHFGSRIAIANDGSLFVTTGDRYSEKASAQSLDSHLGKVIHITASGEIPPDNPYGKTANGLKEIWSYGHRNLQGAAINPTTGALWTHEHGPRGGDELNISRAGKNYGWPVIGYGIDYSGAKLHDSATKDGMEQPIHYWVPSIAPSGMAFYTSTKFPEWKNSLFIGALAGQHLARLTLNGDRVVAEEKLLTDLGQRIRDVRQGPDGFIYVLTDDRNGKLFRIAPI